MNWRNVKTVWVRELRDQLRDRRTLFMVAVLPLLMYPLMGMSFFQLAQFMRSHVGRVAVLGAEQLDEIAGLPPLLVEGRFDPELDPTRRASKLVVEPSPDPSGGGTPKKQLPRSRSRLASGDLDVVVVFPDGFAQQLEAQRDELKATREGEAPPAAAVPTPVILHNSSRDASRLAFLEVDRLIAAWRRRIADQNLAESRVPTAALEPFSVEREDVAQPAARRAGVWAKLLPFVVLVWALTGAFYPAVDLCAGEKERGTLETLLVSPASRTDLVWGKLLTVATFSMATALLNLAGIAATGRFIAQQMAGAGPLAGAAGLGLPPASALFWLVVALPPVAALFSALSFACAAFARSTKEGQYYFMPLFLGTMPLMLMPMSPGVELNLGTSLAPLMGLVLLLRSLLEGNVLEAVRYAVPVTIVTFGCCLLAIRWAVSQFNQESVLFRGDERFDLRLWLASLRRRRGDVPTVGMAVGCVVLILLLQFAVRAAMASYAPAAGDLTFRRLAVLLLVSQACVLLPAVLVTGLLTRRPRATLLVDRRPVWPMVAAAAGLAVAAHPLSLQISAWIRRLYPLSEEALAQAETMGTGLLTGAGSAWVVVLLMGLLPAICEELTFRGCVLSGLRTAGSSRWAVVISAVAFGVVHTAFLQQALSAMVFGVLLGYLAVATRSLWPCIAFHAVHNSLPVLIGYYAEPLGKWLDGAAWRAMLVREADGQLAGYHPAIVVAGSVIAALLLRAIHLRAGGLREIEPAGSPADAPLPVGAALAAPKTPE